MNYFSSDIHDVLSRVFGYSSFRPGQEDIITSIMNKKDTIAILPTGGGKSICYQIPALLFSGLSLIVSPLISLMTDQVITLQKKGIAAVCLHSQMDSSQQRKVFQLLRSGQVRLLYLSPERLVSRHFRNFIKTLDDPVSFVCIDEAHCISQWGHEFRPSYQHIIDFITDQRIRPVIAAFTASSTPEVRDDMISILSLNDPNIYAFGFDRPNLYYEVRYTNKKWSELLSLIHHYRGQCGIIYAATRKNVESIEKTLTKAHIPVLAYHGGMDAKTRDEHQKKWLAGDIKLMIATNAFGMGIDKPNVRFVIHYNIPKNLEDYYQEAGRAGRDGLPSDCILLFHEEDLAITRRFIGQIHSKEVRITEQKRLQAMMIYAGGDQCLRKTMLNYFGERSGSFCGNCSVCLKKGPFQFETHQENSENIQLYQALKDIRARISKEEHLRNDRIMSDAALHELARRCPENMVDLLFMESTSPFSALRFGKFFLEEIRSWKKSHLV